MQTPTINPRVRDWSGDGVAVSLAPAGRETWPRKARPSWLKKVSIVDTEKMARVIAAELGIDEQVFLDGVGLVMELHDETGLALRNIINLLNNQ